MNLQHLRNRLARMSAHVNEHQELVLEPVNGSPRVIYAVRDGAVIREGQPMSARDLHYQLQLDGPVALWLRTLYAENARLYERCEVAP